VFNEATSTTTTCEVKQEELLGRCAPRGDSGELGRVMLSRLAVAEFASHAGGFPDFGCCAVGRHMASAIENSAGLNCQHGGSEIAAKAAGGGDFRTTFGFDVSYDQAVDLDFADFDIRVHDGVLSNDESIAARDGSMESAVNPERVGELEFPGDVGALIQKSGNLLGLAPQSHKQPFRIAFY
jgi:hypothetical protein